MSVIGYSLYDVDFFSTFRGLGSVVFEPVHAKQFAGRVSNSAFDDAARNLRRNLEALRPDRTPYPHCRIYGRRVSREWGVVVAVVVDAVVDVVDEIVVDFVVDAVVVFVVV